AAPRVAAAAGGAAVPALRLEGVTRRFDGVTALDRLDLKVAPGERVAIIGPSGAGKTTLFRLLNLTLAPDAGRIEIEGTDVGRLTERERRRLRARIGTIYQQQNLVGRLPVVHNVLAGELGRIGGLAALRRLVWPGDVSRAVAALDAVGIAEKLTTRTDRLSGGQQQRVAIARLLLQDPAIILADEPVSSVDPALAEAIIGLLTRLAQERGKTLVVSLHSVGLALAHFPRIVGLRAGRVVFDLPPAHVTEPMLTALYGGEPPGEGASADEEAFRARIRDVSACRPLL
ncbi:MAG TPA: phosphonate ABC transporter ATP-binding protein, partial [Thermodesulfobacteriota bacterium]|nr:phosphonate ABC transporter ATP-binding protein [Thermodesulfobacteriota bacterium]